MYFCRRSLAVHYFIYEYAVLKLVCGSLRYHDAVTNCRRYDDGSASTVAEKVVAVAEDSSEAYSSGAFADGSAYCIDLYCMLIYLTVAHDELHLRHLLDGSIQGAVLLHHVEHLVLCH